MIKYFSIALLLTSLSINLSYASSSESVNNNPQNQTQETLQTEDKIVGNQSKSTSERPKYESIIDEYKKYLLTIDKKTRDEIVVFRKKSASLKKEIKSLFKSLSQEAQTYLKKEQQYKSKLPLNKKSEINIPNQD